ncbi:MAG: DUF302 domain-containing protein [Candidatus Brocadiales bacterium]|nr:DUF302 domain-containing protein [Candidatus Brocadiales bacterium]
MKQIGKYALQVQTSLSFDETIIKVTNLLMDQGFGILTEIDVKATFKSKLDVDWKSYAILGACNPTFAYKSLQAEPHIGVLLPCNVVIWDDGEKRVVAAMEPNIMGSIINNPVVKEVAGQVSKLLRNVLDAI